MPKLGDLYILHLEIPDWYYQDILEKHLYHVAETTDNNCVFSHSYPGSSRKLPKKVVIKMLDGKLSNYNGDMLCDGETEWSRECFWHEACLTKDGRIRSVYLDPDSI